MTLTCNLLAEASLARKTVGYKIWRNTREFCVCLSHKQWKPCNIWPCRVPSALDFSPREPSTNSTAVVLVVATCHSVSPHPFLSLWQNWVSSCWPGRLCGKSGPRLATSEPNPPKPHQAVISGYVPVSDLGLVCCELGRGRHTVGEWEGSHMLAVWTSSPN